MKNIFSINKNQHDDLEDWFDEANEAYTMVYSSMRSLKHINNLSDKQAPVFKELEEDIVAFGKCIKKGKAGLKTHIRDTEHLDIVGKVWLIGKWFIGAGIVVASLYPLWKPLVMK